MLQAHEVDVAVLVTEEPLVAGGDVQAGAGTTGTGTPAQAAGIHAAGDTVGAAAGATSRMSRLLNVVDVAVALPALISAMAVWGVVSGVGH